MAQSVFAAALMVVTGCAQNRHLTPSAVKADIERNMSLGSSPAQVAAFLNARGYTSDGPVDAKIDPTITDPDMFEMRSIIRDTRRLFPVEYSIDMKFTFGRDRKLVRIEVDEVGIAP